MGGFTEIFLKNKTEKNIAKHNKILEEFKVNKKFRFYSEEDIKKEYDYFEKGLGVFPEHLFPKNKINSFEDFKEYWNPEALGSCFVPYKGSLTLDCYFGRTPKSTMQNIAKYIVAHHEEIEKMDGSYETFMERGMSNKQRQVIEKSKIKQL